MASKKITAMPNWGGNQVPTDLMTGVDLSQSAATQNVKTTLDDLFSEITKNITDGAVRFAGVAAPAVSALGKGSIYFDSTANIFEVSENGGAYVPLVNRAAGGANEIQYSDGAGNFTASAALTFNSTTNTLAAGAGGLTGKLQLTHTNTRTLTLQPGAQSAAKTWTWMTGYGNANQALITDGTGTLSFGDFLAYPLPGTDRQMFFNDAAVFNSTAFLEYGTVSLNLLPYGAAAGNTFSLRFYELATNGTNYLAFKAPDALAGSVTWTLPIADGTNGQVLSTNGSAALSWTTISTTPSLTDQYIGFGSGVNALTGSSKFLWNDTSQIMSFVSANPSYIYFNSVSTSSAIWFSVNAYHPGTGSGVIFDYVGGNQSGGPGIWWSNNNYAQCSGIWLNLGFNFQGAASSTSPLKIRKATSTSANGNIVFAFYPDSGFFDLQPYGVSATETARVRFSELAANGTNYIEFRAPDALTGNTTLSWPDGAGSPGQVLTTNGSNTLSWTTPGGGGLTIGATAIASGTAGRILYEAAANVLGETAGFSYQPATSPNLTITAQAASYVGLRINSAASPSVNIFETTVNGGAGTGFVVTSTGAPSSPGGTDSERYGAGSTLAGTRNVVIGKNATDVAAGADTVVIGYSADAYNRSTVIGSQISYPGSGVTDNILLGFNNAPGGFSGMISLGSSNAAPDKANTFFAGSPSYPMNDVYFGKGQSVIATPTAYTINGTGGSGADIAGAAVNLAGGKGTGTGIPGTIGIQFARASTTSSSLNALSDEWRASYSAIDTITLAANIKTSTTILTSAAAINAVWTTATHASRTAAITFSLVNNAAALTEVFRIAPTALTLADAVNFVFNTTTGSKIGTATSQKIGFWNATPVIQQTSAALTNNVTSGGTNDIIANYTDLTVYANDAATIRDDIYQLARKLKEVGDALRTYGILG